MEREITFEIIKHIGVIGEGTHGFRKELNIVRWNNGVPKYDIRSWNNDYTQMTRGLTLSAQEADKVASLLAGEFNL